MKHKKTMILFVVIILMGLFLLIGAVMADGFTPKILVRYKLNRIVKKHPLKISIERIHYSWAGGELIPSLTEFKVVLKDNTDNDFFLLPVSRLSELNAELIQHKWEDKNIEVASVKKMLTDLGANKNITALRFGTCSYVNNAVYIFFNDSNIVDAIPSFEQVKEILKQNQELKFYFIPHSFFRGNKEKLGSYYNFIETGKNSSYLQLKNLETEQKAMQYTTTFNPNVWWQIYYTKQNQQEQIASLNAEAQQEVSRYEKLCKEKPSQTDSIVHADWEKKQAKSQQHLRYYMWRINMELNSPVAYNEHLDIYVEDGLRKVFKEQLNKQYNIKLDDDYFFRSVIGKGEEGLICNWLDVGDGQALGIYYAMNLNTLQIVKKHIQF